EPSPQPTDPPREAPTIVTGAVSATATTVPTIQPTVAPSTATPRPPTAVPTKIAAPTAQSASYVLTYDGDTLSSLDLGTELYTPIFQEEYYHRSVSAAWAADGSRALVTLYDTGPGGRSSRIMLWDGATLKPILTFPISSGDSGDNSNLGT